jgi:group I intron endonuclease
MATIVCGVYLIRCLANGCVYVGQAVNCRARFNHHKHQLRKNKHGNPRLQNAWIFYGEAAFDFTVTEECDVGLLDSREQHYLDTIKAAGGEVFNCGAVAPCPNRGRKLQPLSTEHKNKISAALLGHKRSPEERKIIAERSSGRVVSEETREKQRAAKLGKKQSLEHAALAAAARVGKPHKTSETARRNLIERNKSMDFTPEIRAKMRQAMLGRTHTAEAKAKCAEAAKRYWANKNLEVTSWLPLSSAV